jgi:hypothetical protein
LIVIVGDSWGVGEWDKNCCLSGPGFGQYLMLHDRVLNLSVGAASNGMALDRLEDLLAKFCPDDFDTFYWIVTSPDRCRTLEYFLGTSDLGSEIEKCLEESFSRANMLAQKYSIDINLIGGVCDLNQVNLDAHSNLKIAVESWGELLMPGYAKSRIDPFFFRSLGESIDYLNIALKKTWVDYADQAELKYQSWETMRDRYFSTDGTHPDRHAHLVLKNYLYPDWKWYHDDC